MDREIRPPFGPDSDKARKNEELFKQVIPDSETIPDNAGEYDHPKRDNAAPFEIRKPSGPFAEAEKSAKRELPEGEKVNELNKLISGGGDPSELTDFLQANINSEEQKKRADQSQLDKAA